MRFALIVILFIAVVSIRMGLAAEGVCGAGQKKNAAFERAATLSDEAVRKFANQKPSASKADQMLSTLASSKAQLIQDWMKKNQLNGKPEDDVIRAWRLFFAKSYILSKYPHPDQETNQAIQKLMSQLEDQAIGKERRSKWKSLFEEAKTLAIETLDSLGLEKKQKDQIAARVKAIRLSWMSEALRSDHPKSPIEYLGWGIAYDPVPNEINVGLEALRYSNDETLVAVFAHEIAHSFDSCRWGAFFGGEFAFEKVAQCLRGGKSIGAKKRDDSKMDSWAKETRATPELVASLKQNPTCNKIHYPPVGVQSDQLPEAFADWFSAEALSNSKRVSASLRSDLCEERALQNGSSYPVNSDRLNRIYLAHPRIRKKLGISAASAAQYCKISG